jgi:hypothetical protein
VASVISGNDENALRNVPRVMKLRGNLRTRGHDTSLCGELSPHSHFLAIRTEHTKTVLQEVGSLLTQKTHHAIGIVEVLAGKRGA